MRRLVSLSVVTSCLLVLALGASALAAKPWQPSARTVGITKSAGEVTGFSGGVLVTAALSLSRKWSKPSGQSVTVDGHRYPLEVRHNSVVGPQIARKADAISTRTPIGVLAKAFVTGVAAGATNAPAATGRFEARLMDATRRHVERW